MADNLDDGEFWLPPQFLVDDDNMLHQKPCATTNKNIDPNCLGSTPFQSVPPSFPFEFGTFGGFSDFGSSGESLKGSSETESDEEESVAGLTTLRMPRSSIDDVGFTSNLISLTFFSVIWSNLGFFVFSDNGFVQISSIDSVRYGEWKWLQSSF